MKRRLLQIIFSLLLFTPFFGFSQSFTITGGDTPVHCNLNKVIHYPLSIQNNSNHALNLKVSIVDYQLASGQYANLVNNAEQNFSGGTHSQLHLKAKEISNTISIQYYSGIIESNSTVKLKIENLDDPKEFKQVELNFLSEEKGSSDALLDNSQIEFSSIFPNPASDYAYLHYQLKQKTVKAEVVMQNVLGNVVQRYTLDPYSFELKIDTKHFSPGVYFYTLFLNDEGVLTRKIIVKK